MITTTEVRALVFDVFGTVVDYRGTIIREGEQLNREKGLQVDWATFADAWRGQYRPNMERVMKQELPWTNLDGLHRMALDELLKRFGVTSLSEEEKVHLNKVWHRLQPWSDAVAGLMRLKQRYILGTLSNGNVGLLVDMAKYSNLPWDVIFSAELVKAYKPDPRAYQMTYELLGLHPQQVMLVAAHADDLHAAQKVGLRAGFVSRPLEYGPDKTPSPTLESEFDIVASDFEDLARQMGV
ncbi:MAG: haloacid dehalogenase type II [Ktedonobacteraceae bacterium]